MAVRQDPDKYKIPGSQNGFALAETADALRYQYKDMNSVYSTLEATAADV